MLIPRANLERWLIHNVQERDGLLDRRRYATADEQAELDTRIEGIEREVARIRKALETRHEQ